MKSKKKAVGLVFLLALLFLLVGCSNNDSSSDSDTSSSTTSKTNEIPVSKALTKYKLWYRFRDDSMIAKDSYPDEIFYFDGNKLYHYNLYIMGAFRNIDLPSFKLKNGKTVNNYDDFHHLTISQLLKMSVSNQLKYAKSFYGVEEIQILNKVEGDGSKIKTVKEANIKFMNGPKFDSNYKLNIITDNTGNETADEELDNYIDYYDSWKDQLSNVNLIDIEEVKTYPFKWHPNNYYFTLTAPINYQTIYNYTLGGYYTKGKGCFVTPINPKDNVAFTLDTPKTKGSNITVDAKED
ncbi:hypothetical protein LZD76_05750 [Lactobacillus mulieris]|uniref:hypothetical protein n=1 Tax=Lactobacillus mulieris TaxID=2508708 RepID=UPI001432F806|nr:hypothetical protein [Lactobacillus mulieris]MCF1783949.1 hypothetical protein [Lactobacillus mulieris]MCW8103895.1 hypothetical protein [Lactobacillus mulieris]MDK6802569.1 hypothetical protein [Lactobacillus mulieris]MDK8383140.1 hypothetical protein [Lactobacillus mulieris]MDT9621341.1 hypothetical protein [Lactobacillus mulieris]